MSEEYFCALKPFLVYLKSRSNRISRNTNTTTITNQLARHSVPNGSGNSFYSIVIGQYVNRNRACDQLCVLEWWAVIQSPINCPIIFDYADGHVNYLEISNRNINACIIHRQFHNVTKFRWCGVEISSNAI